MPTSSCGTQTSSAWSTRRSPSAARRARRGGGRTACRRRRVHLAGVRWRAATRSTHSSAAPCSTTSVSPRAASCSGEVVDRGPDDRLARPAQQAVVEDEQVHRRAGRVRRAASSIGLSSSRRSRRYQAMTGSTHWPSHALMRRPSTPINVSCTGRLPRSPRSSSSPRPLTPPRTTAPPTARQAALRQPRPRPARRRTGDRRGAGHRLHWPDLSFGGGDDDLTVIGGNGSTGGLATLAVTFAGGADMCASVRARCRPDAAGGTGRDQIDASARTTGITLDESAGRLERLRDPHGRRRRRRAGRRRRSDNVLDGGAGDDLLVGRLGDDDLRGGVGSDTVSFAGGPAVSATLLARVATGQGSDRPGRHRESHRLRPRRPPDRRRRARTCSGRRGNDRLDGRFGNDVLDGGTGRDDGGLRRAARRHASIALAPCHRSGHRSPDRIDFLTGRRAATC